MNIQSVISLGQTNAQPELRTADAARGLSLSAGIRPIPEPTPQQVQQAVDNINLALHTSNNTALQFTVDPGGRTTVVRLVDTESGELIRQFPSEAALAIAESIDNFQKGLLIGQEA